MSTNHALVVLPDMIVREGWRGAVVFDRQRIIWTDHEGEVVGYHKPFAERLIREAARYWFVAGIGVGYGAAFVLFLMTRGFA